MAKIEELKPKREKRCENCVSYDGDDRTCRANFPVAIPIMGAPGQIGSAGIYPAVPPDGWCRKWEAKLS